MLHWFLRCCRVRESARRPRTESPPGKPKATPGPTTETRTCNEGEYIYGGHPERAPSCGAGPNPLQRLPARGSSDRFVGVHSIAAVSLPTPQLRGEVELGNMPSALSKQPAALSCCAVSEYA